MKQSDALMGGGESGCHHPDCQTGSAFEDKAAELLLACLEHDLALVVQIVHRELALGIGDLDSASTVGMPSLLASAPEKRARAASRALSASSWPCMILVCSQARRSLASLMLRFGSAYSAISSRLMKVNSFMNLITSSSGTFLQYRSHPSRSFPSSCRRPS